MKKYTKEEILNLCDAPMKSAMEKHFVNASKRGTAKILTMDFESDDEVINYIVNDIINKQPKAPRKKTKKSTVETNGLDYASIKELNVFREIKKYAKTAGFDGSEFTTAIYSLIGDKLDETSDDRLKELTEQMNEMESQISEYNDNISALQNQIDELKGPLNKLRIEYGKLQDEKMHILQLKEEIKNHI